MRNIYKLSNTKSLLEKLTSSFCSNLLSIVPVNVAKKVSQNTSKIFEYYIKNKTEQIFLVLEKNDNFWRAIYKVCPKYLDDQHNLEKLEYLFKKNIILISLEDFYIKEVKKYHH